MYLASNTVVITTLIDRVRFSFTDIRFKSFIALIICYIKTGRQYKVELERCVVCVRTVLKANSEKIDLATGGKRPLLNVESFFLCCCWHCAQKSCKHKCCAQLLK